MHTIDAIFAYMLPLPSAKTIKEIIKWRLRYDVVKFKIKYNDGKGNIIKTLGLKYIANRDKLNIYLSADLNYLIYSWLYF